MAVSGTALPKTLPNPTFATATAPPLPNGRLSTASHRPVPSASPAAASKSAPVAKGSAPAVLIVEDDSTTRDLIVRALSADFAPCAAKDAEEALAMLGRMPTPNAVITDVMMPGMDGFRLARTIRTLPACKGVPVMFLTARDSPADIIDGINAGARHYLTKPFKIEELIEKVRRMTKR